MNNQTICELNNRNLDNCLFSVMIIPTKIYFKENDNFTSEKVLYLIFACNIRGVRKYISSVFADDFINTSSWYDLILSFKSRGINCILYAIIPNNDKLSKALKLLFPNIEIFISCFETVNKLSKYYSCDYSFLLLDNVKTVYLSPTKEDYEIALNNFNEKYLDILFIRDLLDSDLKRAKKYYDTDYELRKFIFSFYFFREINKRITVISHSKPYFASIDEFIEILIPDIVRIESRMFCTKDQLKNIINKIYLTKGDLIKQYL